MRFDKFIPADSLKPYIKHFVVSENECETEYKVFPSSGLVIGFQYKGRLAVMKDAKIDPLSSAGITGMSDTYKIFKNSAGIGTILVCFTEVGFAHFTAHPAHTLFNQSIALDYIFDRNSIAAIEEKLAAASADQQRIQIVEQFLLSQLKDLQTDRLVTEAVRLIYQAKGAIKIKELHEKLFISQSPFEKRFRKIVGTTPKKFSSIVRFNTILNELNNTTSLTTLSYDNNFYDQAHFIKHFRQFTGDTPQRFRKP